MKRLILAAGLLMGFSIAAASPAEFTGTFVSEAGDMRVTFDKASDATLIRGRLSLEVAAIPLTGRIDGDTFVGLLGDRRDGRAMAAKLDGDVLEVTIRVAGEDGTATVTFRRFAAPSPSPSIGPAARERRAIVSAPEIVPARLAALA
jgi:hypothetical protein